MATIKECTNMMLNEIAPYIDEMLAVEFAEIDEAIEEGLISLDEATKIKKKKMSALSKALLGTAALGVGGVAGVAASKYGGKALAGYGRKLAGGWAKGTKQEKLGKFLAQTGRVISIPGRAAIGQVKKGEKLIRKNLQARREAKEYKKRPIRVAAGGEIYR